MSKDEEESKDLDEEGADDDESEGEDFEDEDEEAEAADARPAPREERARAKRSRDHDDEEEESVEDEDEEDPSWWLPHAVMVVLVIFGFLGFVGILARPGRVIMDKLGIRRPTPVQDDSETKTAAAHQPEAKTPAPPPVGSMNQRMPRREGEFGAKHLLVMYKGSMRAPASVTRTKEEAKTRAEEALKKIKGGAKFEDVVKEYSDEPNAGARGGDLGTFNKGQMAPPFQAGVEATKVGEVSGLVESPFGYHVILRTK